MQSLNAVAVILGGGAGTRLHPLTRDRAKPAVPIAGKYRLVDIPISNCLNSHIRKMFLLTQFNSVSLHQHIQSTYRFDNFHNGFVRILAAQQTPGSNAWFEGTADAVRKTLSFVTAENPKHVVILSGDQLYRMDFNKVIAEHEARGAEVTIASKPVQREEAGDLGIMEVDASGQIVNFVEKPGTGEKLDPLRAPLFEDERFMASMGIYVFNTDVLEELLDNDKSDFGHDIIPTSIKERKVYSYVFDDYWKDIGTIGSFHEANLALTDTVPGFSFYQHKAPIFTHMRFLPPSKINCCDINHSLLSEGCIISGHRILHSVIGVRATVGEGTVVEHSIIMGADYTEASTPKGVPSLGVGCNCYINNAIIDKSARIGDGCYISPEGKDEGEETELYIVRDGVIVIPKNAVIPPNTRL